MPEGDSIFNAAAKLRPFLVGEPVIALYEGGVPRGEFAARVVTAVRARGKHLLIEVEGAGTIHLHFRMNGRMWIDDGPAELRSCARSEAKLRTASLALVTARATIRFTRTPVVEILRTPFVHAHPALARLGPDLLGERATDGDGRDDEAQIAEIVRRARAPELAERAIAEVLLSQRVAAGIGNIYKCEALFLERVNPFIRARELDDETMARLYRRARELLRANVGPTRPRRRVTTADMTRGERPARGRGRFFVYRRVGKPCFECGATIESVVSGDAGRSTYFCPKCQVAATGTGDDGRVERRDEERPAASKTSTAIRVRELEFGDE